jgi:hypothetical protein
LNTGRIRARPRGTEPRCAARPGHRAERGAAGFAGSRSSDAPMVARQARSSVHCSSCGFREARGSEDHRIRYSLRSHRPPYRTAREIEWTPVISTRSDQKMARSSSICRWACRASSTTSGSGRSNRSTRSKAGRGWATRREDQVMPKRKPDQPPFLLFGPIYFREEIGRW